MPSKIRASDPVWRQRDSPAETETLVAAGLEPWWAEVLARRGVTRHSEVEKFIRPSLAQLYEPSRLDGLEAAISRLISARDNQESVAVVGDYDVDGISATALLTAVFQMCGISCHPILPNRQREGYGFQPLHVEQAQSQGCALIVTADCGSTSVEAAQLALAREIDLIVTDHHLSESSLPAEVIELNPNSGSGSYPFPFLSGAGVAYKLALGFTTEVGRQIDHLALLRIACLGTICDLVPLVGENRAIAALGLDALSNTRSVGLLALMRQSGISTPLTASDVGFRLGPRINAAGRLADPEPALELLLTRDEKEGRRLAILLDQWNRQRQEAEAQVVTEATALFSKLQPLPPILVAWSKDWHKGVVGIAAGRLARQFHRPTVLLGVEDGFATGSGRSIHGIHLFDFLSQWKEKYQRFGGHAQAIGLTLEETRLEGIQALWTHAADAWNQELLQPILEYEITVSPDNVSDELMDRLRQLEPHGVGNRQPVLRIGPLTLLDHPRRFGRGHLSARAVSDGGEVLRLLGWGWQKREASLQGRFEVLGTLEYNTYEKHNVIRLVDARGWVDERPTTSDGACSASE